MTLNDPRYLGHFEGNASVDRLLTKHGLVDPVNSLESAILTLQTDVRLLEVKVGMLENRAKTAERALDLAIRDLKSRILRLEYK